MRPFTLRPPLFFSGSTRLFSGSVFVISSKVETDMKRRPGLVGLYLRTGISSHLSCRSCSRAAKSEHREDAGSVRSRTLRARVRTPRGDALQRVRECEMDGRGLPSSLGSFEDLDRLALAQLHDRLLPAGLLAADQPTALRLGLHLEHVHGLHLDAEQLLDGLADLRLVRVGMDAEGVLALLEQLVALLGDHGREQDLVRMQAHWALPWTRSTALSLISSERARTRSTTSSSPGTVTTTRSRLRKDLISPSSSGCATTSSGSSLPHVPSRSIAALVEGASNADGSTTPSVPPCACAESAPRIAALRALRFTFPPKLRIVGGNATPPPVQCGARVVPARARPVPFWRHGFARPPATMPRLLAPRVPARASFCSATTVSWTRCGFTSAAKTPSSSVTLFEEPSTGALGAATTGVLPDLDVPVLRARHSALDEQQVPLGVDVVHGQSDLGHALAAHPAGALDPLEDARGRRRGADRAGRADIVRAVRDRATVEVVALDRAREALADPDPRHLDPVARLEGLDGHRLARHQLARAAELDQLAVRAGVAELAEASLGHLALGDRIKRELHRLVAVRVDRLDAHDRARAGLDHRHRGHLARLLVEELGHAQFLAEDRFHGRSPSGQVVLSGREKQASQGRREGS